MGSAVSSRPPAPRLESMSAAEVELVDAAAVGYQALLELARAHRRPDLTCEHCAATLFQPTSLGDGATYCRACVPKVPRPVGREVGFGKATNKTLEQLSEAWFPAGSAAARLRQDGNAHFAAGRFAEAAAVYSDAIEHRADAVLLCNRSAARLRLQDADGALRDACLALHLSEPSGRMWAKALFRLGSALNATGARPANALVALAMVAAWSRVHREPLDSTLRALREAAATFARAASLAADPTAPTLSLPALVAALREGGALESAGDAREYMPADVAESFALELAAARERADNARRISAETVIASRECVECPLCVEQLHEPTAIPCGHVLCRSCLSRALDQAFDMPPRCPLCRDDLAPFLTWLNVRARAEAARTRRLHSHGALQLAVCRELQSLLAHHMPVEAAARAAQVRAGEAAAGEADDGDGGGGVSARAPTATIPVFICSVALPGVRCPLHVFEPRYRCAHARHPSPPSPAGPRRAESAPARARALTRGGRPRCAARACASLMMRRCIDSGRREFGMAPSQELGFGTTLLIDEFTQLPDGRARIATTGARRFRVLEWGNKDGYSTARVEWINDAPLADADATCAAELGRALRAQLDTLLEPVGASRGLGVIEAQLGPIPDDDALLPFWASFLTARNSVELQLALAFGNELRTSPLARLRLLLQVMSRAIAA